MSGRSIIWSAEARANLIAIRAYIAEFSPGAAERVALALLEAAESLDRLPHRGRPVGDDRRELVVIWPYLIRYRVSERQVIILRIRHGAQEPQRP